MTQSSLPSLQTTDMTQQKVKLSPIILSLLSVVILGVGTVLGYAISRFQGMGVSGLSPVEVEALKTQLEQQTKDMADLKDKNTLLTGEKEAALLLSDTGKRAERNTKLTILAKDSMISQLRNKLEQGGVPLSVGAFAVSSLPERAYEYRLDLYHISPIGSYARGSVKMTLVNGDYAYEVDMPKRSFSFKDSEALVGRFTMPNKFTPKYIDIRVTGSGKDFEQRYSWRFGEVIPDMPDTLIQYQEMLTGETYDDTSITSKPADKSDKKSSTKSSGEKEEKAT